MNAIMVLIAILLAISSSFGGLRASLPVKPADPVDQLSTLSGAEVREIVAALNATNFFIFSERDSVTGKMSLDTSVSKGEYHGTIAKVHQIIEAIASIDPVEIAGIDKILLEPAIMLIETHTNMHVEIKSWPSPNGIAVSFSFMATDERVKDGKSVTDFGLEEVNMLIPGQIADPDQDLSHEDLKISYWQALGDCAQTAAVSSAVFFEMTARGKQPYTITESSVVIRTRGECVGNDFELGIQVVSKAADVFGDGNGITTPWEIENLSQNLPAIYLAGITKKFLGFFPQKPQYPVDVNWSKARQAYQEIKNIRNMSREIVLY